MSDRTEAPTPRRKEEAREEGQVAHSHELNSAVVLLASALLLRGPGRDLIQAMKDLVVNLLRDLPSAELTRSWILQHLFQYAGRILPPLGILMVGVLMAGMVTTLAQTRFLWSSKRIGFDFKRLNPLNGFKRIFSPRGLVEMLKSLLKLLLIGWVAYSFLRKMYPQLIQLENYDLATGAGQFVNLAITLTLQIGGAYLALAAADYAYQRWELMRNLRMTKEEIKEEFKRSEGDPFLKSRIRQQQRRMARGRMMANVPKATVVVTNPTHLAIAIEYREGMRAPKVLAKGAMKVAQHIVAIAKENSIPVVQNIPLARAIYKTIDIDQEISPDLYMAMAEVLAYVYRLRGRVPKTRQPQQAQGPALG